MKGVILTIFLAAVYAFVLFDLANGKLEFY
jgi:hypothetical protein